MISKFFFKSSNAIWVSPSSRFTVSCGGWREVTSSRLRSMFLLFSFLDSMSFCLCREGSGGRTGDLIDRDKSRGMRTFSSSFSWSLYLYPFNFNNLHIPLF